MPLVPQGMVSDIKGLCLKKDNERCNIVEFSILIYMVNGSR